MVLTTHPPTLKTAGVELEAINQGGGTFGNLSEIAQNGTQSSPLDTPKKFQKDRGEDVCNDNDGPFKPIYMIHLQEEQARAGCQKHISYLHTVFFTVKFMLKVLTKNVCNANDDREVGKEMTVVH